MGDPLDTPLPCDVKLPGVTFRKGVALRTLVEAAARWKREAGAAYAKSLPPDAAEQLRKLREAARDG
jgi:hypothetical protein